MTYEVRQYQPGRESAFADEGLDADLEDAFNQGFDESYDAYQEAISGADPEEMMPQPGDIAVVQNLAGSIDLTQVGFQIPANLRYPPNYQGIRVTPVMSISDYIEWYFNEFTGGKYLTVVKNEGIGAQAEIMPPVHAGARVMLAEWVDSDGNPTPLPPGVVVVANAPPARMTMVGDNDNEAVRNYNRQRKSDWYCFLLESNLNIYQDIAVTDEDYMIDNFDGEYSQWMLMENGERTRVVSEYVADHINNRFVPAGFGLGSRGKISPGVIPGSVSFTNDRPSGRGRTDWWITLLPENLRTLSGAALTPENFVLVPEVREETVVLSVRPTAVDSSVSNRVWVNVKSGKTKSQDDAPGSIWIEAPKIILMGQEVSSTLDDVAELLQSQGISVDKISSPAGRTIGLTISDDAARNAILSTAAPVVESGQTIRYG